MPGAGPVQAPPTTVVCGSLAYDNIMVFEGRFGEHILPDKVHLLNVAFEVPQLRREFGGCAGNIAYNLALLGEKPLILASTGSDFGGYRRRIEEWGLDPSLISELPDQLTAQAYIITDLDDNQITAFHPGAMNHAHRQRLWSHDALCGETGAFIVTDGAEGARIHHSGTCERIPAAKALEAVDPTGCGDAFRAGLAYGIVRGWNWRDTGRLAALLGAIKVESAGTQNHRLERARLEAKFKENYGYEIDLGGGIDAALPEPQGSG